MFLRQQRFFVLPRLDPTALPQSDYHIVALVNRIGARFAYLSYCYRSSEYEAEDGKYKKDAGDYFVPTHFCGMYHVE
jgi:hypothetical protein